MDDVDIDEPHGPRHRVAWTLGALAAIVVGIIVAVDVGLAHQEPAPEPSIDDFPPNANAAQETYLVYARWEEGVAFAKCMTARGFPREPIVRGGGRFDRVANFLGISPVEPTEWLAPAEARNGTSLENPDAAQNSSSAGAVASCKRATPLLDLTDAAAVRAAVSAALEDDAFRFYVAERIWFDDHPGEAQLYITHQSTGFAATPASPAWEANLDAVLAFVGDAAGWVAGPREGHGEFSQVVGRVADGSFLIIRVGDSEAIQAGLSANFDRPPIPCGGVAVIVGTATNVQSGASAGVLYAALAPEVCAVLR